MLEAERPGVERLALEFHERGRCRLRQLMGAGGKARAVDRIAEQRVADMGHVDADLVGPPGLQPAFDQACDRSGRRWGQGFFEPVVGDGMLAAGLEHGHLLAVGELAPERGIDRALGAVGHAPDQRDIAALHLAVGAVGGELGRQAPMRPVVLGDDHQAAGFLVEPVHDARPFDAADARQAVAAMGNQGVDQGAGPVAGGRMHNQARRFVDDDERIVLVYNIQRNQFCAGHSRFGRGDYDLNQILR